MCSQLQLNLKKVETLGFAFTELIRTQGGKKVGIAFIELCLMNWKH